MLAEYQAVGCKPCILSPRLQYPLLYRKLLNEVMTQRQDTSCPKTQLHCGKGKVQTYIREVPDSNTSATAQVWNVLHR